MVDFRLFNFIELTKSFINAEYKFQTFQEYILDPEDQVIIFRHDVDRAPERSLKFAQIENELGITGTYYFRAVPKSFNKDIIKQISKFGHEIGYHYEDFSLMKGELDKSILRFEKNLNKFRAIISISTICMHGSPISKYDNRKLWEKYDYHDFGIIGESYFDLDFNEIFYLTDTGRRWNGDDVSVRDKVETGGWRQKTGEGKWLRYQTTMDIIKAVDDGTFPKKALITFHPQRWNDKPLPWIKELLWQNTKNVVKKYFYVEYNYI